MKLKHDDTVTGETGLPPSSIKGAPLGVVAVTKSKSQEIKSQAKRYKL
jgi:hypothetical protein